MGRTTLMTPEEIQRTMDFILQNQANSVVRLEQIEEGHKRFQEEIQIIQPQIASLTSAARDLLEVSRYHGERIGRLDNLISVLTQLAEYQSKRLDRLE
jgi:hypothetical protein